MVAKTSKIAVFTSTVFTVATLLISVSFRVCDYKTLLQVASEFSRSLFWVGEVTAWQMPQEKLDNGGGERKATPGRYVGRT
jgi:hypothetical protein